MGQICCKDSTETIESHVSDRERLIPSDVTDSANSKPIIDQNVHNSNIHEDDYKNKTNTILKEAENQMVNANITDTVVLDQVEIDERTRFYRNKVKFTGKNMPFNQLLPRATGNPSTILAQTSLNPSDITFMQNVAKQNSNVLNQMLEPDSEELIEHFAAV